MTDTRPTPNEEPTTEALRARLAANDATPSLAGYRALAVDAIEARATPTPGLDVDRIVSLAKAAAWSARYNPERSLDEIADDFRGALSDTGATGADR